MAGFMQTKSTKLFCFFKNIITETSFQQNGAGLTAVITSMHVNKMENP